MDANQKAKKLVKKFKQTGGSKDLTNLKFSKTGFGLKQVSGITSRKSIWKLRSMALRGAEENRVS